MTITQTITSVFPEQIELTSRLVLNLNSEASPSDTAEPQSTMQSMVERLRVIYLQYINCDDELSLQIQEIAEKFICMDCSKISHATDLIKLAQDCKKQFARVLCSDFDRAPLQEPVVVRDWRFEAWQLHDYISLDKFFGQRQEALSPFDLQPFPGNLPTHEFALAIIRLLKTIPEFLQEANTTSQLAIQSAGDGKMVRQEAEVFSPESNFFVAWQRYEMWKKLARAAVQEKKCHAVITQLEIDIAARRLENENHLQLIINEEATRMLAYFAEQQQAVQAHLDEAEQARGEIARLKEQLDEAANNLKKLRADLGVQEKRSNDLQQQIYVEQAKYARLAQEVQELRNRCKKRPWWKFW